MSWHNFVNCILQCSADCMDLDNELKLKESQLKRLEEDLEYKKQVSLCLLVHVHNKC